MEQQHGRPGGQGATGTTSRPAESVATEMVLDAAALDEIRGLQSPGQPEVLPIVVSMFAQECPQQLGRLRAAIARADAAEVRTIAHSLKGSAAALGARQVQALCQRLEGIAAAGTVEGAANVAATLAEATARACAALAKVAAAGERV